MEKRNLMAKYDIISPDALVAQQKSALLPRRDDGVAPFPAHHFLCLKKVCIFCQNTLNYTHNEKRSKKQSRNYRANQERFRPWGNIIRRGKKTFRAYYSEYQQEIDRTREEIWAKSQACIFCGAHALEQIKEGAKC